MSVADPRLLWLALLAPLFATLAGWAWRRQLGALARWASRGLWDRLLPGYRPRRLVGHVALVALAVLGVTLALARPRWGSTTEEVERRGVDVVLVLDSSLSMSASDVLPDRLTEGKLLARQLVSRLAGHRLALVQSEGEGEVLAPLTLDRAVIDLLLDSVTAASLPTPGTRLATGVARALELFPAEEGAQRVLVMISDGEDHGEEWPALLRQLEEARVVVHAIAVGTRQGSLLPLPGSERGYKLDEHGEPVVSRVEPAALARLVRATGGELVLAERAGVSPQAIVAAVGKLEGRSLGREQVQRRQERFQWFLAPAALALALALLFPPFAPGPTRGDGAAAGGTT
jgi:Ca-activated chloride channel family protein